MSRDIKFRAWNTEAKYMIQDPTSMGSVMREHVRKALDLNGKLIGGNYELIQFTGLKNKNGVDIFDGDVLRYYSDSRMIVPTKDGGWESKGNPHLEERTTVEYSEHLGAYMVHGGSIYLYEIHDESEVIGNIFENPELMEGWK